jgi:hypothetical protein
LAIDKHGAFSPQAGDYRFVTEAVGRRFHSAEYRRLLRLLQGFDRIPGYPPKPQRVADLGGATGVIGLYLASHHPGCQVVVYDHAQRPLELGRKWARDLDLGNVEYVKASYRQLARNRGQGGNDLVLFFYGLDMYVPGAGPNEDEQAAMGAVARFLAPNGVGVVDVTVTRERFPYVFEAIRRAGLGVDWRYTRCVGTRKGDAYGVDDVYIFVRRGMPHLGADSKMDALACAKSKDFPDGQGCCDGPLPEAWANHFRDAEELIVAEGLPAFPDVGRLRVLQRDVWLLLEITWRDGGQRYSLRTLTGIGDFLRAVHDGWEQAEPVGFGRYEVHPRLQQFIAHCRQQPVAPSERRGVARHSSKPR